ncbi:MAG: leucine--tRNA ligase, partial [Candidatus Aenigmarchaeota archaeon]|nr:leucine--tRNA ligase [Candidatus Aenigmarchaeota archaeon]
GFLADWRRFICTINPDYQKFIEWQFKKLNQKKLLIKKPYYATFCPNCGPVAVDASQTDISKGGNAEKHEFTLLKFKLGNEYLVAATLRPEIVYGQTNIWVNPKITYVKIKIDNEIWIVSKECENKLRYQKDDISEIGKIDGTSLIGKYVVAPEIKRKIIILPSKFCDPTVGTGIVTSVPSDAPFDWAALRDLQENKEELKKYGLDYEEIKKIKPIPIIESKKWGDLPAVKICKEMNIKNQSDPKLEEATKEIYKKGFHTGIMKETCGEFAGLKVEEAKEIMRKKLIENGEGDIFYDLSEEVVCRCGSKVIIKRIDDQWFIKYSDKKLTEKSKEHIKKMKIYPEEYVKSLPTILDWFDDRACVRLGNWLGTKFPFDKKWVIEPISDSTLYPAFYIVSKYVNSGELKPSDLTEKFFDYVYLGKGKGENEIWEKVKKDFDYWYPLDMNLGGKEHKTVHFPVFLMNHVAILPEGKYPRGILVHWYITGSGGKISKSKGGAYPIPDAAEKYSIDAMRMYYSHIANPFSDVEWKHDAIISYKENIRRFYNIISDLIKIKGGIESNVDKWMISSMNSKIKKATEAMEEFNMKKALDVIFFELMKDVQWYLRRGGNNKNTIKYVISNWLKMLSPFIPHICEELWERLGEKPFISTSDWPIADESKINKNAELGEELIKSVISDIEEIKRISGIEKPKKIKIFLAPKWKYDVYNGIKEGKDIKDFMRSDEYKKIGKELVKYIQSMKKNAKGEEILDYENEKKILKDGKEYMENNIKTKIELIPAEKSNESKAKQAEPMKPGILIE